MTAVKITSAIWQVSDDMVLALAMRHSAGLLPVAEWSCSETKYGIPSGAYNFVRASSAIVTLVANDDRYYLIYTLAGGNATVTAYDHSDAEAAVRAYVDACGGSQAGDEQGRRGLSVAATPTRRSTTCLSAR